MSHQPDAIDVVQRLRGGLVVSCQAGPGHPLHGPATIARLARCAELGGATAVRVEGADDVRAVAAAVSIPVIGLVKVRADGDRPYITPTYADCRALVEAGAGLVAVESTREYRADPGEFADLCARVHHELGTAVMADVSTAAEGRAAWRAGADLVATTLSGYTSDSDPTAGPDLELVERLVATGARAVLEGRVRRPEEVAQAFALGAWAVVVGSAITAPDEITRWFVAGAQRDGEQQASVALLRESRASSSSVHARRRRSTG
jgi:N-acylglucosamine-6-phosphate 2-epimerase